MCLRAVLLACALALVAATPAAASKHVLTTIGQGGPTTCTVTVEKIGDWPFQAGWYDFSGETSCDRAIDQSGQARLDAGEYGGWVYAPACSGFRTTCTSSSTYQTDDDGLAYYRFTLVAPHGQAWLWRGSECQGSGSDRITCEYTGDNLIWWST